MFSNYRPGRCTLLLLWGQIQPTRPSASGLLTATLCNFHTFVSESLTCHLFIVLISLFITLCSPFCPSVSLPLCLTTKTFHLDKIKLIEVAVKINHFLHQGGNKELPERKERILFFSLHTINQFPFKSFHIFLFLDNNGFD